MDCMCDISPENTAIAGQHRHKDSRTLYTAIALVVNSSVSTAVTSGCLHQHTMRTFCEFGRKREMDLKAPQNRAYARMGRLPNQATLTAAASAATRTNRHDHAIQTFNDRA